MRKTWATQSKGGGRAGDTKPPLALAMPLEARSMRRPGVATRTWTGLYMRIMSSRRTVPPVVAARINKGPGT